MEFELTPPPTETDPAANASTSFQISARPILERAYADDSNDAEYLPLPHSYGTESLCLMARDPHSIFAFWDIDWTTAFRALSPNERKVHLRLLDDRGGEQSVVEIEPLAGSCYITVPAADATYGGEIGYYHPATVWHCLATSELVTTPADSMTANGDADFATVPFHLSFQHMVDLLETTRRQNDSLTEMLADLQHRVTSGNPVSAEEQDLARILENAQPPRSNQHSPAWTQRKLERILGSGNSSPTGGFGGSSRS